MKVTIIKGQQFEENKKKAQEYLYHVISTQVKEEQSNKAG